MDKLLTLYAWFTCLLIVLIIIMDVVLLFKFKRYYQASGFGIVTCTLLSLVFVQALGAFVFGAAAIIIITSSGRRQYLIDILKITGISWLTSSTLLHTIAITILRIYSVSYGNRVLKFVRSKVNIALVLMKIWFVSLALALVAITSGSATTYSVFYLGLFVTGLLAVMSFFVTIDTSLNYTSKSVLEDGRKLTNPIVPSHCKRHLQIVQHSRKTFILFSGIVISFAIFSLPTAVPNLYFTLRGVQVTQSISLMVALWMLVGVVFNSLWMLMRLRTNLNDSIYAKRGIEKDKHDLVVHYQNISTTKKDHCYVKTRLNSPTKLLEDEETGMDTEYETISQCPD